MRASSLFGLRSGPNSATGSPVQTPIQTPSSSATQQSSVLSDLVEPLFLPPSISSTNQQRSRPLNRLGSLTPFRKATQSPARDQPAAMTSPVPSPLLAPTPALASSNGSITYLDSLSLRLGDAVNKALTPPVATHQHQSSIGKGYTTSTPNGLRASTPVDTEPIYKGKRPIPIGRGRALGALIQSELYQATDVLHDPFLHRAILRLLQRPLTVLTNNLTQQLSNLLITPEFAPSFPLTAFNAVQLHSIALAHFASEILETFDSAGLGKPTSGRSTPAGPDALRSIKEGFENVITKVIGPFIGVIKSELLAIVADIEKDVSTVSSGAISPSVDKFDKAMSRISPLLSRLVFSGESGQSAHIQSILATFEIGSIWSFLVAVSLRTLPKLISVPPTPNTTSTSTLAPPLRRTASESGLLRPSPSDGCLSASSSDSNESVPSDFGRNPLPAYVTPPDTPQIQPKRLGLASLTVAAISNMLPTSPSPPSSKKLKLPSINPLSRAPSPPLALFKASPISPDIEDLFAKQPLQALHKDLSVLVASFRKLPVPLEGGIAKEAVDEAFKESTGFLNVLEYISSPTSPFVVDTLYNVSKASPTLLILPVLLAISGVSETRVWKWINLEEEEYRKGCLCGFAKAEKCSVIVAKALSKSLGKDRGSSWFAVWLDRVCKEEDESESDEDDDGDNEDSDKE